MATPSKAEAQKEHIRLMVDSIEDMRKSNIHTDVVLCCQDAEFQAHKLVLSAGSQYFRAMFRSGMVEANTGRVSLDNLEVDAIDILLLFLYTGKIKEVFDDKDYMRAVLAAAHMLEVHILFHHYWKAFTDKLTPENFVDVWNTSELYENKHMLEIIPRFIIDNFAVSSASTDFKELKFHQIQELLFMPQLTKCQSDIVVKGVLFWVKHDTENRQEYLAGLLTLVDTKSLSNEYLAAILNEEEIVKNSVVLLNLFLETTTSRLMVKKYPNLDCNIGSASPKLLLFYQNKDSSFHVMYKHKKRSWSSPKLLPFSIPYGCAVAVFGSHVYFFGSKDESYHKPASNVVLRFDSISNAVQQVTNMKVARHAAGAGVLANKILVVGGWMFGPLHTVEQYDPSTDSWEELASTVESHYSPNLVSYQQDLFLVGSLTSPSVEHYNAQQNQWTVVTSVPQQTNTALQTYAAACKDKIYVVSKEGKHFRIFDPRSRCWYDEMVPGGPDTISGLWSSSDNENRLPFIFVCNEHNQLYQLNPDNLEWNKLLSGVGAMTKIQEMVLLFN